MTNIQNAFDSAKEFGGSWNVLDEQSLTKEQINNIKKIEVVQRTNGETGEDFLTMCFLMKSGKVKSFSLSRDCELSEGDVVVPKSVKITVLERDGEICTRADGESM